MSMDILLYVGPYALCEGEPMVEGTIFACMNADCQDYTLALHRSIGKRKFCSQCGTRIDEHSAMVEKSYYEIKKDVQLEYMPYYEKTIFFDGDWSGGGRDSHIVEMKMAINPAEEIAKFNSKCAKQIQALAKIYGASNVSLHYGVLQFVNE